VAPFAHDSDPGEDNAMKPTAIRPMNPELTKHQLRKKQVTSKTVSGSL
jgi:hypothetical protein